MRLKKLYPRLLALTTAALLGFAAAGSAAAQTVLVDFGPNDTTNGQTTPAGTAANTPGQASTGQYWNNFTNTGAANNVPNGSSLLNLVSSTNTATPIGITTVNGAGAGGAYTGFQSNGYQNGGLTNPNAALLGNFALGTVTGDYFFVATNTGGAVATGTLRLSGLDVTRTYNFTLFGTRTTANLRSTTYSVTDATGVAKTFTLQTSGPNAGSAANPTGNDNKFAVLNGLVPNANGTLDLVLSAGVNTTAEGFAYIGGMQIVTVPEPSTWATLAVMGAGLLVVAQRRRTRLAS